LFSFFFPYSPHLYHCYHFSLPLNHLRPEYTASFLLDPISGHFTSTLPIDSFVIIFLSSFPSVWPCSRQAKSGHEPTQGSMPWPHGSAESRLQFNQWQYQSRVWRRVYLWPVVFCLSAVTL
jgi:hypothetical protein